MNKEWPRHWLLALACAAVLVAGCGGKARDLGAHLRTADRYNVRILRDTWGVPHVFGKTDADAAFGLAYAHAEDDFPTIQETLLIARGNLATLKGKDAAPLDYLTALLRVRERIRDRYTLDLSPQVRAICEAYAEGINLYAALHPGEARNDLFPATGHDIAAGFVALSPLFYGLNRGIEELFERERRHPVSQRGNVGPGDAPLTRHLPLGSNAFAVSPRRSSDGQTMLAVNSHQPWEGPVAWYEAHVHSEEGWDATGGLFPGSPVILVGHNRDLGWGATVNLPDLFDIYVLEIDPKNRDRYRMDGEWFDLERRQVRLRVRLPGGLRVPVRREVLWSHFGPVVRRPHGTYAIRYAGMDEIRAVEQWYRMNRARNLDEWMDAMRMLAIPSFNFVYADRAGNIAYLYNGRFPVRAPGYDWKEYLPGNTAETLWQEVYPLEALPQVVNPASGFVQSCNNTPFRATIGPENPRPENFPPEMGIETRMTGRALRALEILGGDESITPEEFAACKWDTRYSPESEVASLVRQVLTAPPPEDPVLREAAHALANWDLATDPDNRGAAIGVLTTGPVVLAPELGRPAPPVEETFREGARTLWKHFGRIDVPWREVNRLRRGTLDLGLGGGPDVLHAVIGPVGKDGRITGMAGDGLVILVQWTRDGVLRSQSIHQYGSATSRPNSPHYADQAPLFVERRMKPVWMNEAEIRAHLEREYRPGEERTWQ